MSKQNNRLVDFRKVKDSVSITQVLEHYGVLGEFSKRGNRLEGPCPIHNGNARSFSVTPGKNTWYCFGQCKQGGNILDLVAVMEKCGVRDAAIMISDWFDLDGVEHKPEKRIKPKRPMPPKKRGKNERKKRKSGKDELCVEDEANPPRPDANQPLTFELKSLEPDHETLLVRNLMSDTATHFGAGYCKRGLLKGRIAVPVHNRNGELLAYAGAATKDAKQPSYLWPKNFNPVLELYNLNRVIALKKAKPPLVVVCDIFDVFELFEAGREHAVALMVNTISKAQLALLSDYLSASDVAAIHFMARPGMPKYFLDKTAKSPPAPPNPVTPRPCKPDPDRPGGRRLDAQPHPKLAASTRTDIGYFKVGAANLWFLSSRCSRALLADHSCCGGNPRWSRLCHPQ